MKKGQGAVPTEHRLTEIHQCSQQPKKSDHKKLFVQLAHVPAFLSPKDNDKNHLIVHPYKEGRVSYGQRYPPRNITDRQDSNGIQTRLNKEETIKDQKGLFPIATAPALKYRSAISIAGQHRGHCPVTIWALSQGHF